MDNLPLLNEPWMDDVIITSFKIYISVDRDETRLRIDTSESYNLSVRKIENNILVNISAPTYFGARHGLETLSQLIWFDSGVQKLKVIHDIEIHDKPTFPHRGLMVDTARNYFPIEQLKKVVDGMATSKLNVFHLHLTDAVSFPIVLPNNKIFAEYGAYGPDMVYTPEDIKGLVEYARIRGVRIILEIDAPSHTNEGWNHEEEKLVICGEENVFKGHLNPDNKETLNVLESVYKDLLELGTDNENFHIGGDEVDLTCFRNTEASRAYSDMKLFWAHFTNRMLDKVKSANKNKLPTNIILWSSPLTDTYISHLNYTENLAVQYWFGLIEPILTNGNKIIFSTVGHWYLDCGYGPWKPSMTTGVCDPYTPWQKFYKYRPWTQYPSHSNQVLGGEACLWSEQVEVDSLEIRIWPRAAALAERLWSDPDGFNDYDVFTRLDIHRERLKKRGLKVAAMWPRWCSQNPGKC
ncbi:hypothetical protein NQ314_011222 [Rhamnusium bicolor]|uniref:beta-N-acetylhexosaminidase n=1 Tax=Rhamnusium bicolor TaxID=1586634 RepID=A0AAV8XKV2_9CUCU|nr:hypothetical protein NQ314_011222 [Rhamnusium bicolor]